jgi:ubiquinone/menaquinone biosynthesis C-methylase UbiE
MTNERAEVEARVRRTFDTVAAGYDHPGASWFDATARVLVREAELEPGMAALDLATGTGKVALALAASEPRASIVGVDLSEGMLAQAENKAKTLGMSNASFEVGSFDTLDYGPRFDVVTCSFGVFFVSHMAEALARFGAQAKPGGRLLISTFSQGSFAPFHELFLNLYRSYGFETPPPPWLRIATAEGLTNLFVEANLPAPKVEEHDFGFELSGAEAWWDILYNAGYRGMLDQLRPEDAASFRERHLADVTHLIEAQGQRRLDIRVRIGSATIPTSASKA